MIYNVSAMVMYSDQVEAESEEEALERFEMMCPYSIVDTAECECEEAD